MQVAKYDFQVHENWINGNSMKIKWMQVGDFQMKTQNWFEMASILLHNCVIPMPVLLTSAVPASTAQGNWE